MRYHPVTGRNNSFSGTTVYPATFSGTSLNEQGLYCEQKPMSTPAAVKPATEAEPQVAPQDQVIPALFGEGQGLYPQRKDTFRLLVYHPYGGDRSADLVDALGGRASETKSSSKRSGWSPTSVRICRYRPRRTAPAAVAAAATVTSCKLPRARCPSSPKIRSFLRRLSFATTIPSWRSIPA